MRKHISSLVIILFFSLWTIRPFLSSDFFTMHDDTQVARVIVMGKALRQGQLPVRWITDLGYGYGYPIFNYYAPLPYYVGGFLYALGGDAILSTKLMFVAGMLLAAVSMYLFVEMLAGKPAGILSAVLYVYAPYHAVQIFVRGAVGEFWVLVFLPVLAIGFLLASRKKSYATLAGGLGLAGIILSHTLLGYATAFFLLVFLFLYSIKQIILRNSNLSLLVTHVALLIIGLGLSAFFWLPAISEMGLTNVAAQIGPTANFRDHFVCLSELWDSPWGYGGSAPGCIDGLSFRVGKMYLLLAGFSLGFWIVRRKVSEGFGLSLGAAVSIISLFFMLSASESLWRILPFFSYLQYPWRFLTFEIFGLSLLGGLSIVFFKRLQWLLLFALIPLIVGINGKLFVPQYTYNKSPHEFEKLEYLRFDASKISDEYLPPAVVRPRSLSEVVSDTIPDTEGIKVDTEIDTDVYLKAFATTERDTTLFIRRAYFPGWEYYVNGKKVLPEVQSGLPTIPVLPGTNVIELVFTNTPIRTIANAITLITILSLLFTYGKKTIT